MARKGLGVYVGSGNVFADIGVREPEEMLAKAQLAAEIVRIIRSRKLTQTAAAKALDTPVRTSAVHRPPNRGKSG